MAARLLLHHQEDIRKKIQVSQLINFLEKHAIKGSKATPSRITAALGLIKKVVPDLSCTTIQGDSENPLAVVEVSKPAVELLDTIKKPSQPNP